MAKPEDVITIVRGTPREPHNYHWSYIDKLDEVMVEDALTKLNMRFTYDQLLTIVERVTQVRSKYKQNDKA